MSDSFADHQQRVEDTVSRAHTYLQAGADCIYPIGCADKETLITLRQRIPAPLNVLAAAQAPHLKELQEIGVNRVSFGPYIFRALLARMSALFDEIQEFGNYERALNWRWSGADVQPFLHTGKEI